MDVDLKLATIKDAKKIFNWQLEPQIRKYFRNPSVPTFNEHLKWLKKSIKDKYRKIFIIKFKNNYCGFLRLDWLDFGIYEISILISKKWQQKKIGKHSILALRKILPFITLVAEVHKDNHNSKKFFSSCGFDKIGNNKFRQKGFKSKTCLIRANCDLGKGYGHFIRCIELAKELKKKKFRIYFIEPDKKNPINKLIISNNFNVMNISDDINSICEIAEGANLLIIDHYEINLSKIYSYKKKTWKLLVFNDFNKKKLISDIVVSTFENTKFTCNKNFKTKLNLIGSKYQIVRSDLVRNTSNKKILKKPKTCTVTIGATDGNGFLFKLLKFFENVICREFRELNFIFIVGPQVNKVYKSKNNLIKIIQKPKNINMILKNSDIAISSSGQSLIEFLYCGIPTIAIILSSNQKQNLKYLIKKNCVVTAGEINMNNSWKKNIIKNLSNIIENYDLRFKLSKNSKKVYDGVGAKRIVNKLTQIIY